MAHGRRRGRRLGMFIVGVMALTAASCGDDGSSKSNDAITTSTKAGANPSGASAPGGSATPTTSPPVDPNATLRWVGTNVLSQWDPTKSINQTSDYIYFNLVYDHLIQLNVDNTLSPALATEWTFSPDGLSLTMKLRTDVTFHDGGKFDAANAVANLDRNRATGILASTLATVKAVTAVDASTIKLDLSKNDPTIVYRLATTSSAMVSPTGLANPGGLAAKPAGSGAFKLVSSDGTTVTLERFDGYWDKAHPYAAKMTITQYQDDNARLNAFKSGVADIASLKPTLWSDIDALEKAGKGKVLVIPGFSQFSLYLNANKAPLNNPVVRKAISMAIDRDGINKAILGGTCKTSTQVVPAGFVGHVDSEGSVNGYNPAGAKDLLKQAGIGPITLNALVADGGIFGQLGTIMQDQLKQIGITLNVTVNPVASLRPVWRKGEFDVMVLQFTPTSPDAITLFDTDFLGIDALGAPQPQLQPLVEAARALPIASKERAQALEKVTSFLNKEPLHIPVCQVPGIYLYKPNVVGADNVPNSHQSADVPDVRYLYIKQ